MEKLAFMIDGGAPAAGAAREPRIVGVVASGNLEVLIEPASTTGCEIEINTAAVGFGATWKAVVTEFFSRHPLGGVRISINDAGATPAIVSLRLDQAVEAYVRGEPA